MRRRNQPTDEQIEAAMRGSPQSAGSASGSEVPAISNLLYQLDLWGNALAGREAHVAMLLKLSATTIRDLTQNTEAERGRELRKTEYGKEPR